jgi:hypothetical protein
LSSGGKKRSVVPLKSTDISQKHITYIFRVKLWHCPPLGSPPLLLKHVHQSLHSNGHGAACCPAKSNKHSYFYCCVLTNRRDVFISALRSNERGVTQQQAVTHTSTVACLSRFLGLEQLPHGGNATIRGSNIINHSPVKLMILTCNLAFRLCCYVRQSGLTKRLTSAC